jgi:hypothetical protein
MFVDGEWRDHVMTEVLREEWEKAQFSKLRGKARQARTRRSV